LEKLGEDKGEREPGNEVAQNGEKATNQLVQSIYFCGLSRLPLSYITYSFIKITISALKLNDIYPFQDDEYNYHDSLQVLLTEETGHWNLHWKSIGKPNHHRKS